MWLRLVSVKVEIGVNDGMKKFCVTVAADKIFIWRCMTGTEHRKLAVVNCICS